MKGLQVHIEQFEIFVGTVRTNVTLYAEIVQKFDTFKPIDNCFLAVHSSCCARRASVHNECIALMKDFVLNEKSKEFFSFFKEKYGYDKLSFLQSGVSFLEF